MDLTLNNNMFDTVNIASGIETTIRELAETLKRISGFRGKLFYNTERPEGISNRAISNERLRALGWEPKYKLEEALTETYEWYNDNI
jgi:GDP-L-fucose synthase